MTAAEFKKYYRKQLENHIKGEKVLLSNEIDRKKQKSLNPKQEEELLRKYADAENTMKGYSEGEGLPFKNPFHWGAMGCYGLG